MDQWNCETQCSAFVGTRRIAQGALKEVATVVKHHMETTPDAGILIFDDRTARQIELDLRGSPAEVRASLPAPPDARHEDPSPGPRGPGRPRLGVISREITLLPRHWEWLNGQPGGASVALRKLVDDARKSSENRDAQRFARESTYRFMHSAAGDQPGFEEASRALFAGDREAFHHNIASWPTDFRNYLATVSMEAF